MLTDFPLTIEYYPFAIKVNDLGEKTFIISSFFEQVLELLTCDFLCDSMCEMDKLGGYPDYEIVKEIKDEVPAFKVADAVETSAALRLLDETEQ